MVVLPRQLLFSRFWDVSCLFTLVLDHLSPKCLLLDPVCPHLALPCLVWIDLWGPSLVVFFLYFGRGE